jgi:adenylate cyclase
MQYEKDPRSRLSNKLCATSSLFVALLVDGIKAAIYRACIQKKWQAHSPMLQGEHIVRCICQAMIAMILLQSLKLSGSPTLYFLLPHNSLLPKVNLSSLHIANMSIHLLLFIQVLILLKRKASKAAKLLLLISFCSYILVACLLWQYNVSLHYYFLLSMFISCYLFNRHEHITLAVAISLQLGLFIIMHHQTSLETLNNESSPTSQGLTYLESIAYINTWVFGISCVICALFVRAILAKNWQQLKKYKATQTLLLTKLFPAELVPPLLTCIDNNDASPILIYPYSDSSGHIATSMQYCLTMGVVFLDIVDSTKLIAMPKQQDTQATELNWQAMYDLFAKYDQAVKGFDAKRIKTNGDQYILLLGLNSKDETETTIALQLIEACRQLQCTSDIKVRIGAAFGPITCGVFDTNNPNFDIWGETVIRAARLEKLALPEQIIVDESLYERTTNHYDYAAHTKQSLKGLGLQNVYSLQTSITKKDS